MNWDTSVYATTTYSYNARDQITESNQAGQLRTFSYDNHGRLWTRTTPEQGTTTYGYHADDTVQTITDARNAVMTFSYNPRKLVTGITFAVPSGVAATPNVSFEYDAAGNRTSMSSTESTVSYGYDTASRLTSESRTFNGVGTFTLSYAYNQLNQLTEITNHWNVKVGYTYNHAGEVTGVTGQGYAGVTSYASGMVYRAFGGLKQLNYANGRSLSASYNNRMFLTQWSIPSVMRWDYAYDYFNEYTGRVVYARNLADPTLDRSYDYDHLGRPTHFTSGSNARHHTGQGGTPQNDGPYSHGYSFDVWGNRTYFEGWGGIGGSGRTETASYMNNRRNGFTYDAAGNLTNDGGQTFTYDATGQQATASYSGYLLQQAYDGDRLRVKKVENGATTYYLRSTVLGGQIVAELNGSGSMTRGFVYLGGQLLAIQQNNQVSWLHQDPVAKSKRVTDASGAVISTIELDPWGGDTNRSSNEAFQPRRFTTYDRDGNSSDEAMHRRYNRWHARFDQPDPYGGSYDMTDPQSFNRYSYVQNDPVNFVDPSGLCPEGTTPHTDPATGRTECVPGPSASVNITPGRDDPFWNSFRADSVRPLITDMTLIPQNTPTREQRLITETRNNLINILNSNNGNNPCAQFFGGAANAIAALNAIPFTPGQLANYRTGISMNIPIGAVSAGATYVVPNSATVNAIGGFYQSFARDPSSGRTVQTPNFGGYGSNNNRSRALQMLHELGHVIVTGRNANGTPQFLLPLDGPVRDPSGRLSEQNTRTVVNACRNQINSIRN